MGSDLDARSDIFTMGLIFYELLTGDMPFRADSAIASLLKRTQERAVPLSDVDPTMPPGLSMIASKCLERDPKAGYTTIQELIDDLDVFEGKRPRSSGTGRRSVFVDWTNLKSYATDKKLPLFRQNLAPQHWYNISIAQ